MSLLRTAAHAAVATRVVGSVHNRQRRRWAAAAPVAAPVAAVPPPPVAAAPITPPPSAAPETAQTLIDQLTQLGQLRDAGVLSEAEFELQKHRILNG